MYEVEIKMMMYAFGDSRIPKTSTSKYVESLVKSQVRKLVSKSRRIQMLRRGTSLEVEDMCFVLRNDEEKVSRLIQSLNMKMYKFDTNSDEDLLENQVALDFDWFNKSECSGMSDRLRRLDEYTRQMSVEEYMEYSKCREASFTYRKGRKFKAFLGMGKIKDGVIDALGFVCHEMVFELVDTGLKIKKERHEEAKDRMSISPALQSLDVEDVEEAIRRILRKSV